MVTLAEIRDDIVDETKSLTPILRKAKILSHKLTNQDFKNWIEWELTGYKDDALVPQYRVFETDVRVDGFTAWHKFQSMPVQIPENLRDTIGTVIWNDGVPQIERFHNENDTGQFVAQVWPTDMVVIFNQMFPQHSFSAAYNFISRSAVVSILETVRDKLLNFVLELETLYPDNVAVSRPQTPQEVQQISHLVHNYIMVSNGGNFQMSQSQFDQSHQQVTGNQYNAGHDINFGSIHTKDDLADTLSDLRKQVEQTAVENDIEEEALTDVKYHLEKAAIETKKDEPNKETIKSRIQNAVTVATSVSALAGLAVNLDKVAAIIDKLF